MEELLKIAKKFMDENYGINEIELTDDFGNKVRLVRDAPTYWSATPIVYQYPHYQW